LNFFLNLPGFFILFPLILNVHRNRLTDPIDSGEHPDFVLVAFLAFASPKLHYFPPY